MRTRSGCIGWDRAVTRRRESAWTNGMPLRTTKLPETLKREVAKLSPEDRLMLAGALWVTSRPNLGSHRPSSSQSIAPSSKHATTSSTPIQMRHASRWAKSWASLASSGARRVSYTSAAERDIEQAVASLLRENPEAAARLVERLHLLEARLLEMPLMYPSMLRSMRGAWLHPFRQRQPDGAEQQQDELHGARSATTRSTIAGAMPR